MNIQTNDPMTVISVKKTATLNTLTDIVGNTPVQMLVDMEAHDIEATGPMIFIYRGVNGDPDAPFELEVSVPVSDNAFQLRDYSGRYSVNTIEAFRYVERTYLGPVDGLGKEGYEPLFIDMAKAGIEPSGEAREVYMNWVGPESPDNRTDIQVGVAH